MWVAVKAVCDIHVYDNMRITSNGAPKVKGVRKSRLTYLVGCFFLKREMHS